MELLREYSDVGESFKEGDIRDFRAKCSKILNNYDLYQQGLKDNVGLLMKIHAEEVLRDKLFERYQLAWSRRERFFKTHR